MNYARACHLLEIDPDAINISQEFIKKKYYIQALRNHPDKNIGREAAAAAQFQEITAAYDFLRGAAEPAEEEKMPTTTPAAHHHTFAELLVHFLSTVLRGAAARINTGFCRWFRSPRIGNFRDTSHHRNDYIYTND